MTDLEVITAAILTAFDIPYEFQYPIHMYCVDFYIPPLRLVIEVDGEYWHSSPEDQEKDQIRNETLESLGYRVVRLSEETLKQDALKAVVHALLWKGKEV